jgi:predicted SAM-dependent methyltransferase
LTISRLDRIAGNPGEDYEEVVPLKPQWLKDIYYSTIGCLAVGNYLWRRAFPRLPQQERIILHLGCGGNCIRRPGFINIDANLFQPKNLWLDITLGLPFPANSIDAIVASHVLEHLNERQVRRVLEESYRVLKLGGGVRFTTPNLGKAIEAYVQGNKEFFGDWPDPRNSIGGRFNNYLLCRDQHRLMFDFGFLKEFLLDAGFEPCREVASRESKIFEIPELEEIQRGASEDSRSLFVEGFKVKR